MKALFRKTSVHRHMFNKKTTITTSAAAAAKSLQSDSVWPHRRKPTRLPRPWDSPGKNTGVGCHFLLQCMKVKSESEVAQSCLNLSDTMDCSLPGSSIHGFSRQEYWSGVPLPSPEPNSAWYQNPPPDHYILLLSNNEHGACLPICWKRHNLIALSWM